MSEPTDPAVGIKPKQDPAEVSELFILPAPTTGRPGVESHSASPYISVNPTELYPDMDKSAGELTGSRSEVTGADLTDFEPVSHSATRVEIN